MTKLFTGLLQPTFKEGIGSVWWPLRARGRSPPRNVTQLFILDFNYWPLRRESVVHCLRALTDRGEFCQILRGEDRGYPQFGDPKVYYRTDPTLLTRFTKFEKFTRSTRIFRIARFTTTIFSIQFAPESSHVCDNFDLFVKTFHNIYKKFNAIFTHFHICCKNVSCSSSCSSLFR